MIEDWWAASPEIVLERLHAGPDGLDDAEAARRLAADGPNVLVRRDRRSALRLALRQVASPMTLLLAASATISALTGNWSDGVIVLVILLIGAALGFWQDYTASRAAAALLDLAPQTVRLRRSGTEAARPAQDTVRGDLILLRAGDLIPADARLVSARDLYVVEAALTGEAFPVRKSVEPVAATAPLAARSCAVWAGTSVRSGIGVAVAVETGRRTLFGAIAGQFERREAETAFAAGLRRFGVMLSEVMLAIILAVHLVNVLTGKPAIDSLLFALALAIGMTPQMLPAIMAVTLASGARTLAAGGTIVKRLSAVENLGAIDVLCTDKTGTLTSGEVRLTRAVDPAGRDDPRVLAAAETNARLQSGLANTLDAAILAAADAAGMVTGAERKLGEIPYDFERRRVSVACAGDAGPRLIVKGAVAEVLALCRDLPAAAGALAQGWQAEGLRVLAVADRPLEAPALGAEDEAGLSLLGFLVFSDPPRPDAAATLARLAAAGVAVKIVSGDSRASTAHLAALVGLSGAVTTGDEVARLGADALGRVVGATAVFAEIDPAGKERIVAALRRQGAIVGYMGDGINDATALRLADVGISVEGAVDVARDAADVILTAPDIGRILTAIEVGRRAFENTMKYIRLTTAASFGNMVSMAASSAVLPFLPLTAGQVLLNNLMSDVPALALARDPVDPQAVAAPHRWRLREILGWMLRFGLLSSVFDALTFVVLLVGFHAGPELFRTGWFIESLLSELAFVFVIRSRLPLLRSRPGRGLVLTSLGMAILALALPVLPLAPGLGFVRLPPALLLALAAILAGYVAATEILKRWTGT